MKAPLRMKNGFSSPNRAQFAAFVAVLLLCLALILKMIAPYAIALFLGGTLALLSYPLFELLRSRGAGPRAAATLVTALMLLGVIGPAVTLTVMAVKQGVHLAQTLAEHPDFSAEALLRSVARWRPVKAVIEEPAEVDREIRAALQDAGQRATMGVLKLVKGIPQILLQAALATLACFFFIIDGSRFLRWAEQISPLDPQVWHKLVHSFHSTAVSTILASACAASVQAASILAGFLILGVPAPFLAGGLTFVLSWIPMIGSVPVSLAGTAYLYFVEDSAGRAAAMVGVGVFTSLIDNLVRPLVLKGRSGMHPLVALVAIIGGINMFGIFGVFIGPILAAIVAALLEIWPEAEAAREEAARMSREHRVPSSIPPDPGRSPR